MNYGSSFLPAPYQGTRIGGENQLLAGAAPDGATYPPPGPPFGVPDVTLIFADGHAIADANRPFEKQDKA